MNVMQKQLLEFHRTMGSVVGCSPGLRDVQLRAQLILSEACETVTAMLGLPKEFELDVMAHLEQTIEESELPDPAPGAVDVEALAETIDGLCDLLYVTYGSGVAFGVDLEPYFNEVHRTNMLKAGGGRDDNGKVLKPKGWQPPRIKEMLQTQLACDIDPCPHIMYVPQSVTEVDPFDPLVIEAIEQAGEELKQDIIGLHSSKSSYRDENGVDSCWKRGLPGIFHNLARKWDRIETVGKALGIWPSRVTGEQRSVSPVDISTPTEAQKQEAKYDGSAETLYVTLHDLAVYSIKALQWVTAERRHQQAQAQKTQAA